MSRNVWNLSTSSNICGSKVINRGVGGKRDSKLKLEDLKASHTLCGRDPRRGKRIRGERFESVRGECAILKLQARHRY